MNAKYHVYLLSCSNGTFYVGRTENLAARIQAHNTGHGARHTRIHRPVSLVATWAFSRRTDASQAERALKRLSAEQKEKLAAFVLSLNTDALDA